MRTAALALTALALAGCTPGPPQRQPLGPGALSASTRTITTPTRPAPTLAQAQQQQAYLAAAALESRLGIDVEPVPGAAPAWWPVGATAQGLGRGQATSIEAAYQAAVRQAGGSTPGAPTVSKIAYARVPTGDYIVWVHAPAPTPTAEAAPAPDTVPTPPPPAVAAKQPEPAPTGPAPSTPATPATDDPPHEPAPRVLPPSPPRDPLAPAWYTPTAREENGRVYMCATAEATTVREAPRIAIESARAALAAALRRDVPSVNPESTFVTPVDGRYRAYVLVSTPGTIPH